MRLLAQQSYEKISIRQVISLAGVGIGSFYEYFPSMETLAAVCVRDRIKKMAATMSECIAAQAGEPLSVRVESLLEAQVQAPLSEPEQWAALFRIERRVSRIEAFRSLYAEFVQLWAQMLSAGPDWPQNAPLQEAAFAAHTMVYGLVSQRLLAHTSPPDVVATRRMLRTAVHGYLSVLAPQAYRLHQFGG